MLQAIRAGGGKGFVTGDVVDAQSSFRTRAEGRASLLILGLLISLGSFARLVALSLYARIPQLLRLVEGGDALDYVQLARNLASGVFRFDGGTATAYRMPGYPMVLAALDAVGSHPLAVQVVQILVDAIVVASVYVMTKRLTANPTIAVVAAAFVAVNPILIATSISVYPETLAIGCVTEAEFALLSGRLRGAAGAAMAAALGIGLYLKPSLAILAGAMCLCFAWRYWPREKRINRRIVVALLPFVLLAGMLAPWVVRNARVFHAFVPLTTSAGINLYGGNNPQADGGFVWSGPYVLPGMSEVDSQREFSQRARSWISDNPTAFAVLLPAKAGRFLWPLAFSISGVVSLPSVAFIAVLLGTVLFWGLVALGIRRLLLCGQAWQAAILILPQVTLLAVSLVTYGGTRYSLPAFPCLAILAASGMDTAGLPRQVLSVLERVLRLQGWHA